MRRQAPERRADEAARRRGAAGRVRHEDAEGGDERGDPRLDHERRDDALPDRLVRRPGAVPRARARPPARDRPTRRASSSSRVEGRLPRSSSRASAAARTRSASSTRFLERRGRAARRRRGRGRGSLGTGRTGVLHGARSSILADDDGQIADAHSISAGLDYPGVGPEHAALRDSGRAEYVPAPTTRRSSRSTASPRPRGSSRRSRARTRSRARSTSTTSSCSSASRAAATRTSPRCSRGDGRRRASCQPRLDDVRRSRWRSSPRVARAMLPLDDRRCAMPGPGSRARSTGLRRRTIWRDDVLDGAALRTSTRSRRRRVGSGRPAGAGAASLRASHGARRRRVRARLDLRGVVRSATPRPAACSARPLHARRVRRGPPPRGDACTRAVSRLADDPT